MRKLINILKNIHKLPKVGKATFLIEDAWNLMAQDNPNEAELLFEEGEILLGSLCYEHKIMKGQIKFKLRKNEECFNIFMDAWSDIEKDGHLSTPDKLYLKWYMYSALEIFKSILKIDLGNIEPVAASDVQLDKVSSTWKRRFPSRDHPDWDK